MSAYTLDFKIDVVRRTKQILEEYEGDYEVTLLINCVSALLNLPIEMNMYNKKGEPKHNNNFQNTIEHSLSAENLRKLCKEIHTNGEEKTDEMLLRLFRNGFSHYDIQVNSEFDDNKKEETISEIVVQNAQVTFYIEPEKLKKFALEMANSYLVTIENRNRNLNLLF